MTSEPQDSGAGMEGEETYAPDAGSILSLLEDLGVRATRPRRLIAEHMAEMAARGADFATEDLWKELQADDSGIGRATVYRTVDLLQREGLLDRVPFADGSHRYRLCGTAHHHHITCVRCQRVVEIDTCLPPDLVSQVAGATGFAIEGHSLEMYGRCASCQDRPDSPEGA